MIRIQSWVRSGEPGLRVFTWSSCAARAGDCPLLTSHGPGPSHAHRDEHDDSVDEYEIPYDEREDARPRLAA